MRKRLPPWPAPPSQCSAPTLLEASWSSSSRLQSRPWRPPGRGRTCTRPTRPGAGTARRGRGRGAATVPGVSIGTRHKIVVNVEIVSTRNDTEVREDWKRPASRDNVLWYLNLDQEWPCPRRQTPRPPTPNHPSWRRSSLSPCTASSQRTPLRPSA